jgi:5,10-methylene-tetrahydrofolate dehydrogenase/methenyl tetrahydrofolate cyclohydrolase
MAKIIDGKKIAETIKKEMKVQVAEWVENGCRAPQLTAVLIGDDPASQTYVNNKMKVGGLLLYFEL